MGPLDKIWLLLVLALRNLFSHRVKSLIVGAILVFGTMLVVMGTALIDSIERAMERSITASVAGNLQIYSSKGKDELALFGSGFMGADDIGRIDDFTKVQQALSKVPNIEAVVPMGIDMASVTAPGDLERSLEGLRAAVRQQDTARQGKLRTQVKELLGQMKQERKNSVAVSKDAKDFEADLALIDKGLSEELWTEFQTDPLQVLEYLDTKVAPLSEEGRMMYFRYLGTDLDLYMDHFDRFEIVKGEPIPPHTRGFMFNERFYERIVKHKVARRLDWFSRELHDNHRTIAEYPGLDARVRQLSRQHRLITYQLDAAESERLTKELQAYLPDAEGGLSELLAEFLTITDANFDERYAWFYAHIAPCLEMYAVNVGDVMTLRAYTRSGFLKALNIKLYGVFRYKGLEKSDLASGFSLVDMLTFRELYGLMTDAKKEELAEIKAEVGLADVAAADAEAAFFGEDSEVVAASGNSTFDEFEGVDLSASAAGADVSATFAQGEVDHGLALNAAVVLKDRTQLKKSQAEVSAALEAAGLSMKVVDWQKAAGLVGQFILVIRGVLYVAILIIFVVAVVIINNSMVMATMERVTEIGTMRAIGAGRGLVLVMFMLETMVLGGLAGLTGAGLGVGLITYLSSHGLPAPSNELIFLFGGPKLFPSIAASNIVTGLVVIVLVSLISTLYPAFIATRIQPIMAMRAED